jgi:hypothetical protein
MITTPLRIYNLPKETFAQIGFPNLLRDKAPEEKSYILERYFSDVYAMFLNKLSFFVIDDPIDQHDLIRLKALFDEIIKIKHLLVDQDTDQK